MLSPGMSAAVTTTTFDQSKAGSRSSAVEPGVRVGRADRRAVPGAREDEVVGVLRLAGQLGRALAAERRRAAGAAGGDRAGLDHDGVGRLGPGRQLGQGPSSMATDSITGDGPGRALHTVPHPILPDPTRRCEAAPRTGPGGVRK